MDEFFRSISCNKPEDFRAMLASDPRLANARSGDGVSAVLWSRYWRRQDHAVELVPEVDALLARCRVS